ncbi:biotin--[acetyl-CoA-carboxylase] ligase [Ectothiorhodospiraceae bacterium WFHF3C12]|nr:biotin--[acetyl-CoA-carboxylase] ligase [Ectothiorhodospiraceae bacterium WFHF3C12]
MSLEAAIFRSLADRVTTVPGLAAALDVGEAEVTAAVARLQEMGLDIRTRGAGLALPDGFTPLDATVIEGLLSAGCSRRSGPVEVVFSTTSTSDRLAAANATGGCLLAEHQSAGRGRTGRVWASPLGANLYLSVKRRFPRGVTPSGCLSLGVGQALAARLVAHGVPARVKWPNDIYVDGHKLAGILIESRVDGGGHWAVVIGVGLNYDLPERFRDGASFRATDYLRSLSGPAKDRNVLAAGVIEAVDEACESFIAAGAEPIRAAWGAWDAFPNAPVICERDSGPVRGESRGVDEQGRLLVRVGDELLALSAGEVQYRALENADT